jgi:peptidoglycan hydrolase-like protein with peptidoglycan-binding domain
VPQDESEKRLISTIQVNLASLGYETDTNDGTMTTRTAIAISQFENANGLKVTGKPTPRVAGLLEAQLAGLSKEDLTTDYLEGHWCTEVTQERSLYKFATDGSYRVGVVGITITQMDGINYFPETNSRQSFFDKFERVGSKDKDRFSMIRKRGSELAFTRGNCFE